MIRSELESRKAILRKEESLWWKRFVKHVMKNKTLKDDESGVENKAEDKT